MAHRRQGPGKVAWLSTEQQAAVVAQSATGAFRTAAEVRQWVAETFGVTYTEGGMYALLARRRVHPKVPRPVTPKVDPAEQDAWEKGA
jgi:transposase